MVGMLAEHNVLLLPLSSACHQDRDSQACTHVQCALHSTGCQQALCSHQISTRCCCEGSSTFKTPCLSAQTDCWPQGASTSWPIHKIMSAGASAASLQRETQAPLPSYRAEQARKQDELTQRDLLSLGLQTPSVRISSTKRVGQQLNQAVCDKNAGRSHRHASESAALQHMSVRSCGPLHCAPHAFKPTPQSRASA